MFNKICATCKYYSVSEDEWYGEIRICKLMFGQNEPKNDRAIVFERITDEYVYALDVGPDFGCIHWEIDNKLYFPQFA